ncbi:FMN-binding protein [Anaerorhabdus sp.]|uniref:FMN-binding protein n=1 Tax=Anaerorhabdus sp. TaxID=1872524 RepID=UPI002FC93CBD
MKSKIIVTMICMIIIGFVVINILAQTAINKVEINDINLVDVANGEYQGYAEVGPVKVDATVLVDDSEVVSIVLNKHLNGLGKKAESIITKIIDQQSINVDSISGATASSVCIKKAIENAIEGE